MNDDKDKQRGVGITKPQVEQILKAASTPVRTEIGIFEPSVDASDMRQVCAELLAVMEENNSLKAELGMIRMGFKPQPTTDANADEKGAV